MNKGDGMKIKIHHSIDFNTWVTPNFEICKLLFSNTYQLSFNILCYYVWIDFIGKGKGEL